AIATVIKLATHCIHGTAIVHCGCQASTAAAADNDRNEGKPARIGAASGPSEALRGPAARAVASRTARGARRAGRSNAARDAASGAGRTMAPERRREPAGLLLADTGRARLVGSGGAVAAGAPVAHRGAAGDRRRAAAFCPVVARHRAGVGSVRRPDSRYGATDRS